jgi:hypothetical protein
MVLGKSGLLTIICNIEEVLRTNGSDVALRIWQNLEVILFEAGFPVRLPNGLRHRRETGLGKHP